MSMRYPGGLIATSPVNARYPSGVWTQAQAIPYQAQNVWTRDQFWPYTTLLLQGDGATNGAQNNTFLDSSSNNFTITRNGNTTQGAFTPYEANGYWSNYQSNVSADYINFTTSPGSAFEFTGDYTIECWIFPTVLASDISLWVTSPNNISYHAFNIDATNYNLYLNGGSPAASIAHGLTVNAWNHVAMVRSGSTITVYTNGVSKGTTTNSSTNGYTNPTIARNGGGVSGNARYMSNLRIVKSAVYTSNFTPSTAPFTAITNTSLLTCQSNRFIDNSANALVATVTGSPSVQAFQPFPGATTWSASVLGGSGYFDGSGDYLQTPSNSGVSAWSTDFTVEGWYYPTVINAGSNALWGNSTSNSDGMTYAYIRSNGSVALGRVGVNETSSAAGVITAGRWFHIAVVRSGSSVTIYVNGVSVATPSTSNLETTTTAPMVIGGQFQSGGADYNFSGYISNFRVVKGTAVYTGAFTPPTAPLTAITNTTLLTNFTNAGIYDNSMMNDLETVGNAQVSTSVVKYGTGSMAFDGSGDYLFAPSRATTSLEGDFTIEYWIYRSVSGTTSIFTLGDSFTASGIETYIGSSGTAFLLFSGNATRISSSTLPAVGAWSHVAVVRLGSTITLYLNGISLGTWSSSTTFSGAVYVGTEFYNGSVSGSLNGYIDDLRITKGVARYITSFTPPPARLPAQ